MAGNANDADMAARGSSIEVAGARIAYRSWGSPDAAPVLLVHGAGAHSGWWQAVAEELLGQSRLVAIDLSGSGDSAWREHYHGELWGAELLALIDHLAPSAPPLVVGHSNGGRVAVAAAAARPGAIGRLLLIDSPFRRPDPEGTPPRPRFVPRPARSFETLEEAAPTFHLQPHEPVLAGARLMQVARESFRHEDGGWTLKNDPEVYSRIEASAAAEWLAGAHCPATYSYGELSTLVGEPEISFFTETYGGPSEVVVIRDARHHLIFDHAGEVAALIRAGATAANQA